VVRDVALAVGVTLLSWLVAVGVNVCIASVLDLFGKSMSFYGNQAWVFPLYVLPPLTTMSFVARIVPFGTSSMPCVGNGAEAPLEEKARGTKRRQMYAFEAFHDASQLLLLALFFAFSWKSRGSAFVPMLALLGPNCAELLCRFLGLKKLGKYHDYNRARDEAI
jgi:hypothetical protein